MVTVIEKLEAGWWLVTSDAGKTQGWIAASFLETNANTFDAPEYVDIVDETYIVIGKNSQSIFAFLTVFFT
jgi:hypothetical protein